MGALLGFLHGLFTHNFSVLTYSNQYGKRRNLVLLLLLLLWALLPLIYRSRYEA